MPSKKSAAKAAPGRRAPPVSQSRLLVWVLLAIAAVVLVGGLLLIVRPTANHDVAIDPNAPPGLIAKIESLYNDIFVYKRPDGNYMLTFGAERMLYVESIVNPNDPLDLPVEYTQSMTAGALAYPAELKDAAIVGLGGGRTAWYLHKSVPDLSFTAIELDPEVARVADQYFGVRAEDNFDLQIMDGRVYLTRNDKQFDVILVDAYRGPFVPFHLLTTEFYKLVASRLKPGGVAVQNVEPTTMLFDSAVATIRAAFEHTAFIRGKGNIVIVAYNGPQKDEATLQKLAAERQAQYRFRYDVPALLTRRFEADWNTETAPLTDDFAPVEYLKAIERHNEKQT